MIAITSLRGEVWAHATSLTTPLFGEVPLAYQETVCVKGIAFCLVLRF